MFVMTALVDGKVGKTLRRRKVKEVTVEGLDMWDKAEMVRGNLATHRKTLDESPFNNQVSGLQYHSYSICHNYHTCSNECTPNIF